jgi:hypothetical protein
MSIILFLGTFGKFRELDGTPWEPFENLVETPNFKIFKII